MSEGAGDTSAPGSAGPAPPLLVSVAPAAAPPPQTTAPTAAPRASRKLKDSVKIDGVLKEQVQLEKQATSSWEQKWSFLKEFQMVCIEEANIMGVTEEEFLKSGLRKRTSNLYKRSEWTPKPSKSFPTTSSGMIGWRSAESDCSVERFGPMYVSPRHTVEPPGRPPTPPQNCIILG